jgi:hypothetical protein
MNDLCLTGERGKPVDAPADEEAEAPRTCELERESEDVPGRVGGAENDWGLGS